MTNNVINIKVNACNEQKDCINGYQLAKFLKNYSEIFLESSLNVYIRGENLLLYMDELSHLKKYTSFNIKLFIDLKIGYKPSLEDISVLESFDNIFVYIKNKCNESELNNLLYCCDKFKNKDKYIAVVEERDSSKWNSLSRVISNLGFKRAIISNCTSNSYLKLKGIEILNPKFDIEIETDGTIRKNGSPNFSSSIFKPVSYMFFPEKSNF